MGRGQLIIIIFNILYECKIFIIIFFITQILYNKNNVYTLHIVIFIMLLTVYMHLKIKLSLILLGKLIMSYY